MSIVLSIILVSQVPVNLSISLTRANIQLVGVLYLATLTCWAFHFANVRDNVSTSMDRSFHKVKSNVASKEMLSDEDLWIAKAEMNALVSTFASATPKTLWHMLERRSGSTSGLATVIANHLGNVRWAVVHEAMKVLRGLAF